MLEIKDLDVKVKNEDKVILNKLNTNVITFEKVGEVQWSIYYR